MAAGLVVELVDAARRGDRGAWDLLVDRFGDLVWAVARGHGLSHADSADVSQTTWLRLAEHLDRIREPAKLGAWLSTTARHEALRVLRRTERHATLDEADDCPCDERSAADHRLLEAERDTALWDAFESLSPPCRTLLRLLVTEPPPTYTEVSAALGIPVGSIGPTRSRCLDRLRRRAEPALGAPVRITTARSATT